MRPRKESRARFRFNLIGTRSSRANPDFAQALSRLSSGAMRRDLIAQQLELALRASLDAPALRLIELRGERPPSDEVREPWIPIKYGPASPDDWFGVVPATARFERARGSGVEGLSLVAKVNPRQGLARTLIPWIIARKTIALDRPYWEYRSAAESDYTGVREQHLYALAN